MTNIDIQDLPALFDALLQGAETGEIIFITRNGQPAAELKIIRPHNNMLRPAGLAAGEFVMPADFNDPLPEDVMRDFEGV